MKGIIRLYLRNKSITIYAGIKHVTNVKREVEAYAIIMTINRIWE